MTRRRILTIAGAVVGVLILAVVVLALIGPTVGNTFSDVTSAYPGDEFYASDAQGRAVAPERSLAVEEFAPMGTAPAPAPDGVGGGQGRAQPIIPQERIIIRTANISLVVNDTRAAIDVITDMSEAMGGFVVSSNTYQVAESAVAGNVTVRVPAERFEEALDQLRGMAVEVTRESISGEDVTEEYVDLQARIESLKAAEQRLLEIMSNAQNTTDLLAAEAQLTIRQAEIESIQGRLQYLEQSAALSRIDVDLTPDIIAQPVEVRWKPLGTVLRALDSLVGGMTGIVDAAIFIVIAVLPRLVLIALLLAPFYFLGRALWRRRRQRP